MRPLLLAMALCCAGLVTNAAPAQATTVVRLTDQQLADNSALVIRGTVTDARVATYEVQPQLFTEYTVRIDEVLATELDDVHRRRQAQRERLRQLLSETERADARAAAWHGATPSTSGDRIQALERELAFLELANRLRDRVETARVALEQLDALHASPTLNEKRPGRYSAFQNR